MQLQHGNNDSPRPGLLQVEQCAKLAVLRVRFVQGRGAGGREEGLAQALCS
jgi:hypothetical protein